MITMQREQWARVFPRDYAVELLWLTKARMGASMRSIVASARVQGLSEAKVRARFKGELPYGEKWTGLRIREWQEIILNAWRF